jgi:hypothetical protein
MIRTKTKPVFAATGDQTPPPLKGTGFSASFDSDDDQPPPQYTQAQLADELAREAYLKQLNDYDSRLEAYEETPKKLHDEFEKLSAAVAVYRASEQDALPWDLIAGFAMSALIEKNAELAKIDAGEHGQTIAEAVLKNPLADLVRFILDPGSAIKSLKVASRIDGNGSSVAESSSLIGARGDGHAAARGNGGDDGDDDAPILSREIVLRYRVPADPKVNSGKPASEHDLFLVDVPKAAQSSLDRHIQQQQQQQVGMYYVLRKLRDGSGEPVLHLLRMRLQQVVQAIDGASPGQIVSLHTYASPQYVLVAKFDGKHNRWVAKDGRFQHLKLIRLSDPKAVIDTFKPKA